MLEIAVVLTISGVLMILAYEFRFMFRKRKWGENRKSFF